MVKINVLIPSYHPAPLVRRCLESVAAQSLPLESVTLVDDASPYDLSGLQAEFPRVHFVRNEKNLGIGPNLNRCLEYAKGDFLTFLHSDDMLAPDWHAVWQENLHKSAPDVDLFMSAFAMVDAEDRIRWVQSLGKGAWCAAFPEDVRRLLRHHHYGTHFSAAIVYRRSFFERFGGFPCKRWPNNSDVYLNMVALIESKACYVPDILFFSRKHAGQSVCQSDIDAARVGVDIFSALQARYSKELGDAGIDLMRPQGAVYQFIALYWLLHGRVSHGRAYREIGKIGNPAGWAAPWTWAFCVRLCVEYAKRRCRKLGFDYAAVKPKGANRVTSL